MVWLKIRKKRNDGFIYCCSSAGNRIYKFDPQQDIFIETIVVSGISSSNFSTGYYLPKTNEIYFVNDNLDIVIYDLFSKETSIKLSGFGQSYLRSKWINNECTIIYAMNLYTSNIVYSYNILTDTYSSVADANFTVIANTFSGYKGKGNDNKIYMLSYPSTVNNSIPTTIQCFDCNLGTFETTNLTLAQTNTYSGFVISEDKKTLYLTRTKINPVPTITAHIPIITCPP